MLFVFSEIDVYCFCDHKTKQVNRGSREEGLRRSAEAAGDRLREVQIRAEPSPNHRTRKRPRARPAPQGEDGS